MKNTTLVIDKLTIVYEEEDINQSLPSYVLTRAVFMNHLFNACQDIRFLGSKNDLVKDLFGETVTLLDPLANYVLAKAFFISSKSLRPSSAARFKKALCLFVHDLRYCKESNPLLFNCSLFWLSQGALMLYTNKTNFELANKHFPELSKDARLVQPFFTQKRVNPAKRILLDSQTKLGIFKSFLKQSLPDWEIVTIKEFRLFDEYEKNLGKVSVKLKSSEGTTQGGIFLSLGCFEIDDVLLYAVCDNGFVVVSDSEAVCESFSGVYVSPSQPLQSLLSAVERASKVTEITYPVLDIHYFDRVVDLIHRELEL